MVIVDGKIKSKQRPRFSRKSSTVFTPKDTVNYENWVIINYKDQCGKIFQGPIRAIITAYYKIPKGYTKKRVQVIRDGMDYPCKKPDGDNIAKIILDSLNKIAFDDDSQVVELTVLKRWTEENERVEFEIEEIV